MRTVARLSALATSAALALTLTGCAGSTTTDVTTDPYGSTAEGSLPTGTIGEGAGDPAPSGSVSDITTDTRRAEAIVWKKWGEPVTIDGVTITIGAPEGITPSARAFPESTRGGRASKLSAKIENGRPVVFKSYDLSLRGSLMSGVVEPISDPAHDISLTGYLGDLLPGRWQTVPVGFAVDAAAEGFAVAGEVGLAEGPTAIWSATGRP